LFLDALSYLSNGKLSLPLERHIQIDIDDMFVGSRGNRMVSDDVTVSTCHTLRHVFLVDFSVTTLMLVQPMLHAVLLLYCVYCFIHLKNLICCIPLCLEILLLFFLFISIMAG